MTEAEWLSATDTYSLVNFLRIRHHLNRTKTGRRKLRLFGCACCRQAWPLFASEPECSELVQAAERFADGVGSRHLLARLDAALPDVQSDGLGFHLFAVHSSRMVASTNVFIAAEAVAQIIAQGTRHVAGHSGVPEITNNQQSALLRDIFGNPFRPVSFSPSWRTDTALSLARQMYESRDFFALPILADALQEAGCDNEVILDHCRGKQEGVPGEPAGGSLVQTGPHVRGCWVVDLVLGKG